MIPVHERMMRLGTESAFDVLAKARALERQGRDIIHLEIGEPDFATPPHIVAAAKKALDDGYTHYGRAPGLPELREAIAREVAGTRGIPVHADQVVVTPGAKPVMFFTMDEFTRRAGPRTKLLILNSPQNPTGGVLSAGNLAGVAALAQRHRIPVLSDEIYHRFSYDGPPHSIASLPGMADLTILLDGFSKAYAMTGWRLGYGVMPSSLVEHITRLMINSNSCTASFTQIAGVAVLAGTGFGQYGEGYLRLSYATSETRLSQALDRMAISLARLR